MKFEHFALNVVDVRAMIPWYTEHLGLRIARKREDAPYTHFLADETGRIVVELYSNTTAAVTDFGAAHPLLFHIGFVATDARATQKRLEKAGAKLFLEEVLPDGSILIMMRDPWGIAIQFCQRTKPFAE